MSSHRAQQRAFGCAAVLVAAMLALPAGARAAPVHLSGLAPPPGGPSISADLYGDLSNNVLTLNSTAPTSAIVMNTAPVVAPVNNVMSAIILNTASVTIVHHVNTTGVMTLRPWHINVGGAMDFTAGTANLTLGWPVNSLIANIDSSTSTAFTGSIKPGLGPIQQIAAQAFLASALPLLNSTGVTTRETVTAVWDSVTPGTASAALTQNGSVTQLDLGLTSSTLTGRVHSELSFEFSAAILNFFGDELDSIVDFGAIYHEYIMEELLKATREFDRRTDGVDLACSLFTDSPDRIACEFSAQVSLTGISDVSDVPEPATLGLFGAGLAGLILTRRRRAA